MGPSISDFANVREIAIHTGHHANCVIGTGANDRPIVAPPALKVHEVADDFDAVCDGRVRTIAEQRDCNHRTGRAWSFGPAKRPQQYALGSCRAGEGWDRNATLAYRSSDSRRVAKGAAISARSMLSCALVSQIYGPKQSIMIKYDFLDI
jgi:hypothetical protein